MVALIVFPQHYKHLTTDTILDQHPVGAIVMTPMDVALGSLRLIRNKGLFMTHRECFLLLLGSFEGILSAILLFMRRHRL